MQSYFLYAGGEYPSRLAARLMERYAEHAAQVAALMEWQKLF